MNPSLKRTQNSQTLTMHGINYQESKFISEFQNLSLKLLLPKKYHKAKQRIFHVLRIQHLELKRQLKMPPLWK
jgi:hypothetical protein